MKKLLLIILLPLISASLVVIYYENINSSNNHQENSEQDNQPNFYTGIIVQSISSWETQLLFDKTNLLIYQENCKECWEKTPWIKEHYIKSLNGSLLILDTWKNVIPDDFQWPDEYLKEISKGFDTRKKLYKKIKEDRVEYGWTSNDPKEEESINQILDIYIKYGNPYKLK